MGCYRDLIVILKEYNGINSLTKKYGDTMGIYNGIVPKTIMGIINHHANIPSGNLA